MRVIAGTYRSRLLLAPRGLGTRPTTDRLRETLFNVLAPRIAGCTFADLFAGSGANGIEALSRGAGRVYFVEQGPAALAVVRGNLKSLGISAGFEIEAGSVASFLRRHSSGQHCSASVGAAALESTEAAPAGIDIAFLDPPYEDEQAYAMTLSLLGGECARVLAANAVVVAEHRHKQPLMESYGVLQRYRLLRQGDAALDFYNLRV
jgi:16S rRNA (guanine966-N2)-methyltransferase